MLFVSFLILLLAVEYNDGQMILSSDIDLSSFGTKFQPANNVELVNNGSAVTVTHCAQLCNGNMQCRTFDYDSNSRICRLFEGAVETGQVVSSGSPTSCVGSIHLQSNLFAAFGQSCAQCASSRYLVCSSDSNKTCQCPKNTFWNGRICKNQGYEDAYCSNNQWCRNDAGMNCSNLHFCTEYQCGNMTIVKADLPGNDLTRTRTPSFSMCCSACRNNTGCRAFTWVSAPGSFFGMCYLKRSKDGGGTLSAGHVSAYY